MFYLGLAAFILAGMAAGIALTGRLAAHDRRELWTFNDLAELFTILLRSGLHYGFVRLTHHRTGHWLQVRKYIHGTDDYGLELGFPHVEWSRDFFPRLEALCQEEGISYRIAREPNDPVVASGKPDIEFLNVDFGKNARLAHSFAGRAMARLFRAQARDGYSYEISDIDPRERAVNSPETDEQVQREFGIRIFPPPQMKPRTAVMLSLAAMLEAGGLLGLLYGFLLRGLAMAGMFQIQWTVHPLHLFGAEAEIIVYDLVCLAALAGGMVLVRLVRPVESARTPPARPWLPGGGAQPADGPPKNRPRPLDHHVWKVRLFIWGIIGLTIWAWFL